jgi:hypothetical protein
MSVARVDHTATLLGNGLVLVAGGDGGVVNSLSLASAELYDPTTGRFTATGGMAQVRASHTATLLGNGVVLVAGGSDVLTDPFLLANAELYDPTTGTFSSTGSMTAGRAGHTATLLANGKVLIAGGVGDSGSPQVSAELYDPVTAAFTATGGMVVARNTHTATLLDSGKVLITGGVTYGDGGAELYDPTTGTFTATGSMAVPRLGLTATLLPDGEVLMAGGVETSGRSNAGTFLASAELYDPAAGTFADAGSMTVGRYEQTATLLPSGKVLIAGGNTWGIGSAELYDPAAGTFVATGAMAVYTRAPTATSLNSGKVLIAGGSNGVDALASAELYE